MYNELSTNDEMKKDMNQMKNIFKMLPSIPYGKLNKKIFKLEILLNRYNNVTFYIVSDYVGNFKLYAEYEFNKFLHEDVDISKILFSGSCMVKYNHNCNIEIYIDIARRHDNFKIVDRELKCVDERSMKSML